QPFPHPSPPFDTERFRIGRNVSRRSTHLAVRSVTRRRRTPAGRPSRGPPDPVWQDAGVIVDWALYREGRRVPVDGDLRDAWEAACRTAHDFVWVGLFEPTAEELDDVARCFGLHPLSVEDA